MPAEIQVRTATTAEADGVLASLTLAFTGDPMARWVFADPQQHIDVFPPFANLFGGRAFEQGSAYVIGDFAGAALWLPPGVGPDEEQMEDLTAKTLPEALLGELSSVFEKMGSYHPAEPHWYLPLIGVDPIHQGKGYGSALMAHALVACDRDRIPAYLEATSRASASLYERHGFELLGEVQAGSSPSLFPMLRKSR